MLGDVEVQDASTAVADDEEAIETIYLGRGSSAGRHAPLFEKSRIFVNSFPGFSGYFEDFHAWPHSLDVAFCGYFVKFNCSGEIRFCNDGNIRAVEYRRALEGLVLTFRY
jgi:hypothetical protein